MEKASDLGVLGEETMRPYIETAAVEFQGPAQTADLTKPLQDGYGSTEVRALVSSPITAGFQHVQSLRALESKEALGDR